jgi:selenocysteine-specific elongation factor
MYVIGTAGHVDHGKSTLVYALTGIDPDRLREEKERGLTIDLGFAWLTLPSGREVSIVDVPGHERFIKNMLAGVGGIDLALIVVAADESVMPQTLEHLAILDLLHIKKGLVVVTKRELVSGDWLELVNAEIEDVLKETSLAESPLVAVSAITGEGMSELRFTIDSLLEVTHNRIDLGRPRLPIDRSFTIPGFGTVVTGTLMDGSLSLGQEVELAQSGLRSRIRGLQTHGKRLQKVTPGTRVAANLPGIAHAEIDRGDVLTIPGWLSTTQVCDVRLRIIPGLSHTLRHNTQVSMHVGTNEVMARVRLLDTNELCPGEVGWAQLRLVQPVALVRGDSFVIRSSSTTLGGGEIIDLNARRHRRFNQLTLDRLSVLEKGSITDILLQVLERAEPIDIARLSGRLNLNQQETVVNVEALLRQGRVIALSTGKLHTTSTIYSARGWSALGRRSQEFLEAYHKQYPIRAGVPKEELRSRLNLRSTLFVLVLKRLVDDTIVSEDGPWVRLVGHEATPTQKQNDMVKSYLAALDANPFSPKPEWALEADLITWLANEGLIVRVSESVVFSSSAYERMATMVVQHLNEKGQITVAQVRDMFNTSRKFALALMEYLDQRHITRRIGDDRVLR